MEEDRFYVTLPSNASMKLYPNNTLARYTTQLPNRIELGYEHWEVALTEILYPPRFYNIVGKEAWIRVICQSSKFNAEINTPITIHLPEGFYNTNKGLIQTINETIIDRLTSITNLSRISSIKLVRIDAISEKIMLCEKTPTLEDDLHVCITYMSTHLAKLLGFIQEEDQSYDDNDDDGKCFKIPWILAQYIDDEEYATVTAPFHTNLEFRRPTHAYIYCDIAAPNIVGDTYAPLLRVVNMETYTNHKMISTIFNTLYYVPVSKREFETIEINIRDDLGNLLSFDTGKLSVRLHFRRCYNRYF